MFGIDSNTCSGGFTPAVFVDIHIENDISLWGDLWCDLKLQVGFTKGNSGRSTGRGGLVGELGTLLDQRLHLVCCHDARTRDDFSSTICLKRGNFQVEESIGS